MTTDNFAALAPSIISRDNSIRRLERELAKARQTIADLRAVPIDLGKERHPTNSYYNGWDDACDIIALRMEAIR